MKVTPSAALSPVRLPFHFSGQQFQTQMTNEGLPRTLSSHILPTAQGVKPGSPLLFSTPNISKSLFWVIPHLAKVGKSIPDPPLCILSVYNSNPRFFLKAPSTFLFYRLLEMFTASVWPPLSKISDPFKYISHFSQLH